MVCLLLVILFAFIDLLIYFFGFDLFGLVAAFYEVCALCDFLLYFQLK